MRPPFSRNLFDLACEQSERYASLPAVIDGASTIGYGDLVARSRRVAAALSCLGVTRGDRVGMLVNNRVEWIELCLGAAAIGAVPAPFSTWSTRREIDFLLADSRTRLLVTLDRFGDRDYAGDVAFLQKEHPDRFPELRRVVVLGETVLPGAMAYADFVAAGGDGAELPRHGECARAEDTAFILFTSGSTSYPKAVPLAHGATIENGFHIGERQGLVPGDRIFIPVPLFWSYGAANAMCAAFTHGACLVLQSRFEPAEAIRLIERHACTGIYTLPAITNAIISRPEFNPARTRSLRTAMTIGTPEDVNTVAEILGASEVCNIYGQTESYGNCCVTWHHWPLEKRRACQGPPLPGVHVRIVDTENGRILPAGEVGLIEVKGYLTPGYEGASREENAKAFNSDGYFRTGDLGCLNEDGSIVFKARDSEMIKRAGINIAPAEIEDVLRQYPGVAAAGVAGAPDPVKGEVIVAFVVPNGGAALTGETLRAHCRALAATYKVPDHVEITDALPVTNTGKLLRRELKAMAAKTWGEVVRTSGARAE